MILYTLTPDELKALIRDAVNEVNEKLPTSELVKEDQLISLNECADFLSVSLVTIHTWKKAGLIPFYRISNKIYFKKNEVIGSLKKRKVKSV